MPSKHSQRFRPRILLLFVVSIVSAETLKVPDGPVLIAGFGSIGRRHFQNLQKLGCRQFIFYRSHKGTIVDDEAGDFPAVNSLAEALSYRPKLAVITNPTSLHLDVAIPAAKAGCDLYIEKPIADSLQRTDELVEIVANRGLVAMIGCQFRFHPLLKQLRNDVLDGRLGHIVGASAEWGEYLPGWHPWEDHRKSYSARADLGGGVLPTLIHPFDYMHWMFGEVEKVHAMVAKVPSLDTSAGEDWADVNLEFKSGVLGRVHVDYLQRPPVHKLSVYGDAGSALWDFHSAELIYHAADGNMSHQKVAADFERNLMFSDAMRHFLSCVATRSTPEVTLADGVAALRMVLQARQAAAA